jgi:hypothetical protein
MKKISAAILLAFVAAFSFGCICFADDLEGILSGNTVIAAAQAPADLNPGKALAGLSMWALIWGLIFNSVGVFAFLYGKKKSNLPYLIIGVILVVYPYAVQQALLIFVIGAALTAALYFFRKGI